MRVLDFHSVYIQAPGMGITLAYDVRAFLQAYIKSYGLHLVLSPCSAMASACFIMSSALIFTR